MNDFEQTIWRLTQPCNGELPRPWMTQMTNPLDADVFVIGMKPARQYPADEISHERHFNALFNRNGEHCRSLYDEVNKGDASPTRRNLDSFTALLNQRDIHNIIETNIVCCSDPDNIPSPSTGHIDQSGSDEEIFRYILQQIAPKVLIVYGVATANRLCKILNSGPIAVPKSLHDFHEVHTKNHLVIPTRSFGPPEFDKWHTWSSAFLNAVADRVHEHLLI